MQNFYELFVELSLQQCTQNDYADKLKVKSHNDACKKLKQLESEIKQSHSEDILRLLLNHKDDRVKTNAASFCLNMNVFVDQAVFALRKIIENSTDKTICFSAKMLLKSLNS